METIWLEIDGTEMMTVEYVAFVEFLSLHNMKYASYYNEMEGDKIIMEVQGDMTEEFNTKLSQFIWFQPITQFEEEPEVSDIDLITDMSNID